VGYQLGVPFRVSLVDVCVALVVLVVVLLPERAPSVRAAYPDTAPLAEIGDLQARLARDRGDCAAVQKLTEILVDLHQSDWALRVAGDGSRQSESPSVWRCFLALSSVHAERFEIREARTQAAKALEACDEPGADCPVHERVRMQLYLTELDAGITAIRQGIDPRTDPRRFREELNNAYPRARFRKMPREAAGPVKRPDPAPGAEKAPAGAPDSKE